MAYTKPHVPTAAQLTQLATLQATQTTARATLKTAQTTLATAQAAQIAADKAVKDYEHFMFGGTVRGASAGVIDDGLPDAA
jgi:multidrug efflux pump subunit AcrA (membrane-fusion protein)